MTAPTATLLYAGIAGMLFVVLSGHVIRLRFRRKTGIGDGGHADLQQAIRVHANFAEYVPFALLLIAFVEMAGYAAATVNGLGIALILARVSHAIGLTRSTGPSPFRFVGTSVTFVVILVASVLSIQYALGG
ncbi:MAG: MAPEG family protein [Alphaproteobacteria bacterium]